MVELAFKAFLALMFMRPFIASLAFPFADRVLTFCLLLAAFALLALKKIPREANRFLPALCLFFFSMLVSVFFAAVRLEAMPERIGMYVTGACLFLVALQFDERQRRLAIMTCAAAGLIISLAAIYQYFFGFSHLARYVQGTGASAFTLDYVRNRRSFFPFVTPNTLGAYLGMLLPLYLIDRKYAALAGLGAAALLLTGSLGSIASVCCMVVGYLLINRKLIGKKYLVFAGIALLLLAAVFIIRSRADRAHVLPRFSVSQRADYWIKTLQVIKSHPLAGVGPGNFNLPSSRYSHNVVLQVFAENGIAGLAGLAWLVMLVFVPRHAGNRERQTRLLIAAAGIFLLNNLVDFSFFLPEVSLVWWLIAGLAARPDQAS